MKNFTTKDRFPWWGIIPYILTLGFGWFFVGYSVTNIRKYYLNRKLLIHLFKTNQIELKFIQNLFKIVNNDVDEYEFDYNGRKYTIWHYVGYKTMTLSYVGHPHNDMIGLFDNDIISKWQVKQIIKHIENSSKVGDSSMFNNFMKNLEEFKNAEIKNDHTFISSIHTQKHLQES